MREQVALTFIVGYEEERALPIRIFEEFVIVAACEASGGCTVSNPTGYCMAGEKIAETFDGTIHREHTFQLNVTTEYHKADIVYRLIRAEITFRAKLYGLKVGWVHVNRQLVAGLHFDVKEDEK